MMTFLGVVSMTTYTFAAALIITSGLNEVIVDLVLCLKTSLCLFWWKINTQ